jgi:hypothetical protein
MEGNEERTSLGEIFRKGRQDALREAVEISKRLHLIFGDRNIKS